MSKYKLKMEAIIEFKKVTKGKHNMNKTLANIAITLKILANIT